MEGHSIPDCYGAMQPSAVFVPLAQLLQPEHFAVATTELFGPFQVRRRRSPAGVRRVALAGSRAAAWPLRRTAAG